MFTRYLMSAAVLGSLALSPAPALAKSDVARVAKQMRDPQMQGAMAAAVRAMGEAMLDMKVAPLLDAAETVKDPYRPRRVDPDARLRDYAGRDADDVPEKLSRRLPAMMGAMGGMAEAAEAMTPALKDMAKQMGAAVGASVAAGANDYRASGAKDDGQDGPYDDDIPSAVEE